MAITRVEKSLGPWGWGLVGYEGDRLKVVVPVAERRGSMARWIRCPVTPAERAKVERAAR